MGHSRAIYMFILIILASGISCNLPISMAVPTPTQTSLPFTPQTPTESPTFEPTIPPSATPSDTPTQTPTNPDLYLPIGIATGPNSSGNVTYFDLEGQLLGELQSPNFGVSLFQHAVIAGPLTFSPGPLLPSLVFYTYENGGEIWLNSNNNATLLVNAPNLLNMIGVPGKSLIAYTLLEYKDYGLRSILYLGDPQSLSTVQPILDNTNTEIYAIKPLAISNTNDQPAGVWYTTVPNGIGGDIIFDPRRTLNYVDLANKKINTYLDMTNGPAGISADQTWIAYTSASGVGPLSIVHNFDFSNAVTFPLLPDSDRGSGEAFFSPDNLYVAWKEASGSLAGDPPSLHETIRIASTSGTILTEIPDSSLTAVSGFPDISWVIPIGWLDTQTLAMEVRGFSLDITSILSVKLDGSGLTYIAPGSFIGFLYP